MTTSDARAVDRAAWVAARLEHLEAEKAFTRQRDELSRQRRELPWLPIETDYTFANADGQHSLLDLFDGRGQLLVYHFMMGPGWDEGCPSCSFWADNYDGVQVHLAARDATQVTIARAPWPEIARYRDRMEWTFPWFSSAGSDFNYDFGVSHRPADIEAGTARYNFGTQAAFGEEMPGISVFARDSSETVYLTYQTFSRGLDMLNGAYHLLDLTPKGRDEDQLEWSMAWLHRHDAY